MGAIVEETLPIGGIDVLPAAVDDIARRIGYIASLERLSQTRPIPVLVLENTRLAVDSKPVEPGVQDEVDDPRDSIGAVNR